MTEPLRPAQPFDDEPAFAVGGVPIVRLARSAAGRATIAALGAAELESRLRATLDSQVWTSVGLRDVARARQIRHRTAEALVRALPSPVSQGLVAFLLEQAHATALFRAFPRPAELLPVVLASALTDFPYGAPWAVRVVIRELAAHPDHIPPAPDVLARLDAAAIADIEQTSFAVPLACRLALPDITAAHLQDYLTRVLAVCDTPADQIRGQNAAHVAQLVRHPAADAALVRRAWAHERTATARQAATRFPELLADPAFRRELAARHADVEVYEALIHAAPPDEAREYLMALVRRNPVAAAPLLLDPARRRGLRIPQGLVQRYLKSTRQALRTQGFAILASDAVDPDAPLPARRRTR